MNGSMLKPQQGVAIITAMLIVALVAVIAVALLSKGNIHVHRTENVLVRDQSSFYCIGAERLAALILLADTDFDVDGATDFWAQPATPLPFEGGMITGQISDRQAKFNLNSLLDGNGQARAPDSEQVIFFKNLLSSLGLDPKILGYVIDWIDTDTTPYAGGGAEDATYMLSENPYRTANQPLTDISELRLIKGFEAVQDPDPYEIIRPFVTALPELTTKINLNTAPKEILKALNPAITDNMVTTFMQDRTDAPITKVGDFAGLLPPGTVSSNSTLIGVKSDYYQLETQIDFGERQLLYTSFLKREPPNRVTTLMRKPGIEYDETS